MTEIRADFGLSQVGQIAVPLHSQGQRKLGLTAEPGRYAASERS